MELKIVMLSERRHDRYICCIYHVWNIEKIKDMEIKRDKVLEKREDISRSMGQD